MSRKKESYETCSEICAASGSNFIASFRQLSVADRMGMEAIYAFMRTADDLADAPLPNSEKLLDLSCFQASFIESLHLAGIPVQESEKTEISRKFSESGSFCGKKDFRSIFPAVVDVIQRYEIPPTYFLEVLHGIRMDLDCHSFRTRAALETYCYHVASAVGLICLHVWGVSSAEIAPGSETPIFKAAVACGKALQWTNILRDVLEDAQNGRVYLPLDECARAMNLPEDTDENTFQSVRTAILAGQTDVFRTVLEENLRRAEAFYLEAEPLMQWIPKKNRRILFLISEVYHEIFLKIRRNPMLVFQKRVGLSKMEKIFLYFRMFFL